MSFQKRWAAAWGLTQLCEFRQVKPYDFLKVWDRCFESFLCLGVGVEVQDSFLRRPSQDDAFPDQYFHYTADSGTRGCWVSGKSWQFHQAAVEQCHRHKREGHQTLNPKRPGWQRTKESLPSDGIGSSILGIHSCSRLVYVAACSVFLEKPQRLIMTTAAWTSIFELIRDPTVPLHAQKTVAAKVLARNPKLPKPWTLSVLSRDEAHNT